MDVILEILESGLIRMERQVAAEIVDLRKWVRRLEAMIEEKDKEDDVQEDGDCLEDDD